MTTLLQLRDAQKRYGDHVLLDDASLTLTSEHKAGLFGRNGCGKSTLCRILTGEEELDAGEIVRAKDLRLGHLRQDDPFRPGETVLDFLRRDTGRPAWRCGEAAGRFEIKGPLLESPVEAISGGWRTRVKVTALLLHEPNLLVLDEPTNFLDLRTQLLLERILRDVNAACLVVSHDRTFLKSVCRQTIEMARGRLKPFPGDVDAYLDHRRKRIEHAERTRVSVEARRRKLQDFIDRNRARAATAAQARSRAKQLERLRAEEPETPEPVPRIRLPGIAVRKGSALRCEGLSIGYPGRVVVPDIDLEVVRGTRVAVVGDNGEGKTTFLRTVGGTLPPLKGEILWGHAVRAGCYAQAVYEEIRGEHTVLDHLEGLAAGGTDTKDLLNTAGGFLFRGADVDKPVSVLSGGERARLCLASLFVAGHDVLVLDEPGNHLDVETLEALAEALHSFRGTVLFTSHDRHFLQRVATDVVEIRNGRLAAHPGGYGAYLYAVEKELAEGEGRAKPSGGRGKAEARAPESKEKARERYAMARRATSLERQIENMGEAREKARKRFLVATDPEEARRLHDEMASLRDRMGALEEEWIALREELGE